MSKTLFNVHGFFYYTMYNYSHAKINFIFSDQIYKVSDVIAHGNYLFHNLI